MHRMAVAVVALLGVAAPAHADLLVNISKSQQRVSVTVDGVEAYRWAVSTGRRGYDTPAGNFRPQRLERHWYSRQYEMTPMPWAMFFHRGYAMHATTEVTNLGRVASHGCVRLRPDNAATLYSLMRRQGMANTKIVVLNGALPPVPAPAVPPAPNVKPHEPGMAAVGGDAVQHFAKAESAKNASGEELAAKTHGAEAANRDDEIDDVSNRRSARFARTVGYRVSISSNEAQVLRERQEWLRGLDRKYGITR
ncbi:MAG TPA: L,D-transpeptidase [Pseudolabrys sp.]